VTPGEVSPAIWTGTLGKVTTLSSKVKSPWKPTTPELESMVVVTTGRTIMAEILMELSKLAVGRDTVTSGKGDEVLEVASP